MGEKTFQVLWVDFRTCKVNEQNLTFHQFSKIMKMETVNDAQILVYENVYLDTNCKVKGDGEMNDKDRLKTIKQKHEEAKMSLDMMFDEKDIQKI